MLFACDEIAWISPRSDFRPLCKYNKIYSKLPNFLNMNLKEKMKQIAEAANRLLDDIPAIAETEVLRYAKENFENQSWQGEAWQERKPTAWRKTRKDNGSMLVNTGMLRNSLNSAETTVNGSTVRVTIASDVPYAPVHNFGFEGNVSQEVGEHERQSKKGKKYLVKAHRRNINQRIPKRQFVGKTEELEAKIYEEIKNQANKILNNI